jgi:hypothetical protein
MRISKAVFLSQVKSTTPGTASPLIELSTTANPQGARYLVRHANGGERGKLSRGGKKEKL